MIAVYKDLLRKCLDWFDPDLFLYISAHEYGMKVTRFQNQLASYDDHVYEMQGQIQYDPLMVPVPKMHKLVSTTNDFGITKNEVFQPYCKDTYARRPSHSWAVLDPHHDE